MKQIFFIIFFLLFGTVIVGSIPVWAADPAPAPETVELEDPLSGGTTDVPTLIGTIIKAALGIVGALSLYMFIVGGFTWLISAGNPERVKSGAKMMLWAAIGVLVTFVSYLALSTLIKYT